MNQTIKLTRKAKQLAKEIKLAHQKRMQFLDKVEKRNRNKVKAINQARNPSLKAESAPEIHTFSTPMNNKGFWMPSTVRQSIK